MIIVCEVMIKDVKVCVLYDLIIVVVKLMCDINCGFVLVC